MNARLTWSMDDVVDGGATATRITLAGELTEGVAFPPVPPADRPVVVDLAGVARINSGGVREWLRFIRALSEERPRLSMERCSVPLVRQFNMVSGMRGRAEIRSVMVPYFCEQCEEERTDLLPLDGQQKGPHLTGTKDCPKCRAAMEVDDVVDSYFAFMKEPPRGLG